MSDPHANRPRLYLIDGSGYIFRAYYAVRPLSSRSGVPTNAVVGFARMLGRLLREEKPELLGIAFDTEQENFRHQIYDAYKANRESPPEDLVPQFALIHELVDAMDIPVLLAPGFEADDVLATLAHEGVQRGFEVVLVSGDKDLMQLVAPHVSMFDPLKEKHYDRAGVIERFGVPPEHVADVLALAGDASDNIPGVPKIGPKGAAKLINEYGDVEQVISGLTKATLRKAAEQSVVDNADLARLSKRLSVVATNAPVTLDVDKLRYTKPNADKLGPFLHGIDAMMLMRDLVVEPGHRGATAGTRATTVSATPTMTGAAAPASATTTDPPQLALLQPTAGPASLRTDLSQPTSGVGMMRTLAVDPAHAVTIDRSRYLTVLELEVLDRILATARTARRFAIDLETTSIDPHRADPVGVSLAVAGHDAVYVPLTHRYLGVPKQLDKATVLARLRPLLEDPAIAKVGQNLKYDAIVLARAGVPLVNIADDAMLAAWVLDSSRASYSLDSLAREVLGHETIHYEDVTGKGKNQRGFDEVELAPATAYAAEDADVALRLCDALAAKVHEAHLDELYRELELPLVPVLIDMERAGLGIDLHALAALGKELTQRLHEVEARAQAMIGGEPVNLASPKQLAELFFVKLGYPTAKKTKTGFSTDQEVLETLAETYELPRVVLEYRLLAKLKSTYVESLPKMVNPETGRVHTSFHQTGTATGRLSSSDPNLQNIPIRSDEGKRIRAAFVAAPGHELISADYSQVELRVMAHLSGDPDFIEAFRRGEDIHTRTAQEILTGGATPDAEARRRAKAINFGILYGLSEFGLARQLSIPRGEAAAYIKAYFGRYPRIRTFLDETIERARTEGFVSTLAGRRRFLPDLNSHNRNLRQAAERVAMNTPIQGSAADLIKMAMLRVHRALATEHPEARLVLQVHDELIVEAPKPAVEGVRALLVREMSGVMTLEVPLLVEAGHGHSWAEAH